MKYHQPLEQRHHRVSLLLVEQRLGEVESGTTVTGSKLEASLQQALGLNIIFALHRDPREHTHRREVLGLLFELPPQQRLSRIQSEGGQRGGGLTEVLSGLREPCVIFVGSVAGRGVTL